MSGKVRHGKVLFEWIRLVVDERTHSTHDCRTEQAERMAVGTCNTRAAVPAHTLLHKLVVPAIPIPMYMPFPYLCHAEENVIPAGSAGQLVMTYLGNTCIILPHD